MRKTAMTLIESLVALIIIGILTMLALVSYGTYKETSLDREAQASLRLMIAAQRIYRIEVTKYFPVVSGSENNLVNINKYLKLILTASNWNYSTTSNNPAAGTPSACAQANRTGGTKTWSFRNTDSAPVSGSCP